MTASTDGSLRRAVNIEDLRVLARKRLPRFVFDFVDGGAEDELTLRHNRDAFERLRFRPRVMRDVSQRDASTLILGLPAALPVIIGPVTLAGYCARHGDLAMARAATAAGLPFVLPTPSSAAIADVAREAPGRLWFQAYVFAERAVTDTLIDRAAAAGYETLVITCDFPVAGKRERDWRSGLLPKQQFTLPTLLDVFLHPRWIATVMTARPEFVNVQQALGPGRPAGPFVAQKMFDPALTWDDLGRFRERWKGRLLLKGVLRADDAERAVALGADGVVLSNHGGRQLDGAISAIDALPEVARAIGGRASIIVDGGVRRGADIARAVALGAEAVIVGRAALYGLAAGGEPGVRHALALLADEFDRVLALTGSASVADLGPDLLMT
ncbi:MAG: alpha-hydroxy-acid oxidizing protein [Gammaproteobacteria bacterium]|nr:alpha-hydroxy-acid oxidizing protein [Gammaproteobacteria bacterium]